MWRALWVHFSPPSYASVGFVILWATTAAIWRRSRYSAGVGDSEFLWALTVSQENQRQIVCKMPKEDDKMDRNKIKKIVEKNLLLITVLIGVIIGSILGTEYKWKHCILQLRTGPINSSCCKQSHRFLIAATEFIQGSSPFDLLSGRTFPANAETVDPTVAHLQPHIGYSWLERQVRWPCYGTHAHLFCDDIAAFGRFGHCSVVCVPRGSCWCGECIERNSECSVQVSGQLFGSGTVSVNEFKPEISGRVFPFRPRNVPVLTHSVHFQQFLPREHFPSDLQTSAHHSKAEKRRLGAWAHAPRWPGHVGPGRVLSGVRVRRKLIRRKGPNHSGILRHRVRHSAEHYDEGGVAERYRCVQHHHRQAVDHRRFDGDTVENCRLFGADDIRHAVAPVCTDAVHLFPVHGQEPVRVPV